MLALVILKNVNYINMMFMWLCIILTVSLWLCIGAVLVLVLFFFFNQISFFLKWISYNFGARKHTQALYKFCSPSETLPQRCICLYIENTNIKNCNSHKIFLAQGTCWHIYKKNIEKKQYFHKLNISDWERKYILK